MTVYDKLLMTDENRSLAYDPGNPDPFLAFPLQPGTMIDKSALRDWGAGRPLHLLYTFLEAPAGAGTLVFGILEDDDGDGYGADLIVPSMEFRIVYEAVTAFTPGRTIALPVPKSIISGVKRFISSARLYSAAVVTGGRYTAGFVLDVPDRATRVYPAAY